LLAELFFNFFFVLPLQIAFEFLYSACICALGQKGMALEADWDVWQGEPQPPIFTLKPHSDTFNTDVR
jgi:hypothetical protein